MNIADQIMRRADRAFAEASGRILIEDLSPMERKAEDDAIETKARYVRTPAGVRRYKRPIGSIILPRGMGSLDQIRYREPKFKGFDLIEDRKGNLYDIGKDPASGGKYVVLKHNTWDDQLPPQDTLDKALEALNEKLGGGTNSDAEEGEKPAPKTKKPAPKKTPGKEPSSDSKPQVSAPSKGNTSTAEIVDGKFVITTPDGKKHTRTATGKKQYTHALIRKNKEGSGSDRYFVNFATDEGKVNRESRIGAADRAHNEIIELPTSGNDAPKTPEPQGDAPASDDNVASSDPRKRSAKFKRAADNMDRALDAVDSAKTEDDYRRALVDLEKSTVEMEDYIKSKGSEEDFARSALPKIERAKAKARSQIKRLEAKRKDQAKGGAESPAAAKAREMANDIAADVADTDRRIKDHSEKLQSDLDKGGVAGERAAMKRHGELITEIEEEGRRAKHLLRQRDLPEEFRKPLQDVVDSVPSRVKSAKDMRDFVNQATPKPKAASKGAPGSPERDAFIESHPKIKDVTDYHKPKLRDMSEKNFEAYVAAVEGGKSPDSIGPIMSRVDPGASWNPITEKWVGQNSTKRPTSPTPTADTSASDAADAAVRDRVQKMKDADRSKGRTNPYTSSLKPHQKDEVDALTPGEYATYMNARDGGHGHQGAVHRAKNQPKYTYLGALRDADDAITNAKKNLSPKQTSEEQEYELKNRQKRLQEANAELGRHRAALPQKLDMMTSEQKAQEKEILAKYQAIDDADRAILRKRQAVMRKREAQAGQQADDAARNQKNREARESAEDAGKFGNTATFVSKNQDLLKEVVTLGRSGKNPAPHLPEVRERLAEIDKRLSWTDDELGGYHKGKGKAESDERAAQFRSTLQSQRERYQKAVDLIESQSKPKGGDKSSSSDAPTKPRLDPKDMPAPKIATGSVKKGKTRYVGEVNGHPIAVDSGRKAGVSHVVVLHQDNDAYNARTGGKAEDTGVTSVIYSEHSSAAAAKRAAESTRNFPIGPETRAYVVEVKPQEARPDGPDTQAAQQSQSTSSGASEALKSEAGEYRSKARDLSKRIRDALSDTTSQDEAYRDRLRALDAEYVALLPRNRQIQDAHFGSDKATQDELRGVANAAQEMGAERNRLATRLNGVNIALERQQSRRPQAKRPETTPSKPREVLSPAPAQERVKGADSTVSLAKTQAQKARRARTEKSARDHINTLNSTERDLNRTLERSGDRMPADQRAEVEQALQEIRAARAKAEENIPLNRRTHLRPSDLPALRDENRMFGTRGRQDPELTSAEDLHEALPSKSTGRYMEYELDMDALDQMVTDGTAPSVPEMNRAIRAMEAESRKPDGDDYDEPLKDLKRARDHIKERTDRERAEFEAANTSLFGDDLSIPEPAPARPQSAVERAQAELDAYDERARNAPRPDRGMESMRFHQSQRQLNKRADRDLNEALRQVRERNRLEGDVQRAKVQERRDATPKTPVDPSIIKGADAVLIYNKNTQGADWRRVKRVNKTTVTIDGGGGGMDDLRFSHDRVVGVRKNGETTLGSTDAPSNEPTDGPYRRGADRIHRAGLTGFTPNQARQVDEMTRDQWEEAQAALSNGESFSDVLGRTAVRNRRDPMAPPPVSRDEVQRRLAERRAAREAAPQGKTPAGQSEDRTNKTAINIGTFGVRSEAEARQMYANTPRRDIADIPKGGNGHIGNGIWVKRCPVCGQAFKSVGAPGYSSTYARHVDGHNTRAAIPGYNTGMLS